MSQTSSNNNGIHCNDCHYEGAAKTNSTNQFIIFFVLLSTSVFSILMIIPALAYMAWIIGRPATKTCPQCKSTNVKDLTAEEAQTLRDRVDDKTPE